MDATSAEAVIQGLLEREQKIADLLESIIRGQNSTPALLGFLRKEITEPNLTALEAVRKIRNLEMHGKR